MPIYEYMCRHCHYRFERRQRFDDEPVAICPCCTGMAHRVLYAVPVIFKGSGFYSTDSRKGKEKEVSEGTGAESEQSFSKRGGEGSGGNRQRASSAGGGSQR